MQLKGWFVFTVLFLLIDYGRLQDLIPVFGKIRPALIITLILVYFILRNLQYAKTLKSKQLRYIWFFILLLFLHIPFARNNSLAFGTTQTMILYMPFIISLIAILNTTNDLRKLFFYLMIFVVFQALYSIFHGGKGTGGQFYDENDLSLFINTWLPFCFVFMLDSKDLMKKIFFAASLLIGIGANVISFSRGGFLGMIAMFIVFWLASTKKLLTLGVVIVIMGGVFVFAGDKYKTEMSTSMETSSGTGRERIESWKSAWHMFLHNPMGVGGNNFQVRFPDYQTPYFKRGMWGRVAHSLWFTLIPELGILGIYVYGRLLLKNLADVRFIKKNAKILAKDDAKLFSNLSTALYASLAGFFVSASFLSVLYYSHYWFLTAFIIVTINIFSTMVEEQELALQN